MFVKNILRMYLFRNLFIHALFSCEKEKVYLYGDGENNPKNYRPYQNPYINNPYSRGYRNPYEFNRGRRYPPAHYDQDYYYVPPSNYRNSEPYNKDLGFNGFDVKS